MFPILVINALFWIASTFLTGMLRGQLLRPTRADDNHFTACMTKNGVGILKHFVWLLLFYVTSVLLQMEIIFSALRFAFSIITLCNIALVVSNLLQKERYYSINHDAEGYGKFVFSNILVAASRILIAYKLF